METNPNELFKRMRNCSLCKNLELGPKPIFQLSTDTKVLIVGQAPGRITHQKGRPFDDPSGVRLRNWLSIDQTTFYDDVRVGIFPMSMCFPGSGDSGDKPPRIECAKAWRLPTMSVLKNVELTLILGRYAIDWHLPHLKKYSVTQAVEFTAHGDGNAFVLPHPSPRNNKWLTNNSWFEELVVPRIQKQVGSLLK